MRYCDQNDLPPLTVIVINREAGAPGEGLTTIEKKYDSLDLARMSVFNCKWYKIILPTVEDYCATL